MKKILFIFILACISSKASVVNRDKEIINSENVAIKQEKDSIIGTWNISRSISTKVKYKNGRKTKIESAFVYNVCPIIVFKKDGTGVLINAVGDKSSFFWLINKEKMCFSFNEKNDENSSFTPEKEFLIKVYHDSKNCFLELIHLKYNFRYILILSSCNGTKNKINNDKVRDSIGVDFSAQSTQVKKRNKVIHSEAINIDSIIGSYHVLYKTQDNGQIVTTYPITDGKGKDTVCYASQDLILTINKDGKNILLNRKIQLDDFRSFIPKNERHKYCISNFKITDVTSTEIKFSINFCIPDTDVCYWFELIISDNGNVKINEVIESESDM